MTNSRNNMSVGNMYVLLSFSKYLLGNLDRSSFYIYLENRDIFLLFVKPSSSLKT